MTFIPSPSFLNLASINIRELDLYFDPTPETLLRQKTSRDYGPDRPGLKLLKKTKSAFHQLQSALWQIDSLTRGLV